MDTFFTWFLVFVRLGAFLLIFPLFSGNNVPVRLRLAIGAALAILITPGLQNPIDISGFGLFQLVLLLLKEISAGLLLGFSSRIVFWAFILGGHFISTEMGLQTSRLITPADSVPVPIPGAVLNMLAIMLFLSLDIHHMLFIAFQRTYDLLPIGGGVLSNGLFDEFTLRVTKLLLLAVQIAAPSIAVSFLLSVVLMMLGKAAPQINIFFESFTIRLLSGLIVFGFSITLASQRIADELRKLPQNMLEAGRILSGQ